MLTTSHPDLPKAPVRCCSLLTEAAEQREWADRGIQQAHIAAGTAGLLLQTPSDACHPGRYNLKERTWRPESVTEMTMVHYAADGWLVSRQTEEGARLARAAADAAASSLAPSAEVGSCHQRSSYMATAVLLQLLPGRYSSGTAALACMGLANPAVSKLAHQAASWRPSTALAEPGLLRRTRRRTGGCITQAAPPARPARTKQVSHLLQQQLCAVPGCLLLAPDSAVHVPLRQCERCTPASPGGATAVAAAQ